MIKDEDVSKTIADVLILSATHNKEIQKLQKMFEEFESQCSKDIRFFDRVSDREMFECITGIEICRLCKGCYKISFSGKAENLVQDLMDEYEGKIPEEKKEKEGFGFMKKDREDFKMNFGDIPIRQNIRSRQEEGRMKNDFNPAFNITSKAPFIKTPHILRPDKKKLSVNISTNKSDVLSDNKAEKESSENVRESSAKPRFMPRVDPIRERNSQSEDHKIPKIPDPLEILWKQVNVKVSSIRDQRLKELDSNSVLFEKKSRDLVHKVIQCKFWIPVTFLVRLTFEQIERNYPLENYLENPGLNSHDLTTFLEELKKANESSKWLFSRPQ